ncbi:DUF4192 family protein [Citricoccus sp. I39-566]|uniref:DUF4192 family protein n=1 Tax=Citricoccus sp. I39-566 TaxID=3073268 RepID=UPI00286B999A|nr:DUF4192 family protein [Citricoccus sp. I39-566]WMY80015.1 DUF4192 family protein [Citricoccus sp. I39-566]
MTDDKPTMRITTPTDLAGAVPHMVGYQPDNNQIAILGFHGPNYIGAAVHTWSAALGDGPAHAAEVTDYISRAFGGRADSYLAIGYGPEGPERALLFQDAFTQQTESKVQAWAVDNDRLQIFTPGRGWSPEAPLETTAGTEFAMVTGAQPAATREELVQQYEPVSEDQQAHLNPDTAERFATMAPTAQYEWAARALTEGTESKTGLTDEQVSIIAHATATSVHIRDNLLADVVGNGVKADRLVDVFRRCDDARRPDMADLAGAAQFISQGSTVAIEAITRHTTGELGRMANHAATLGLDPKPLVDSIDRNELRQRLTAADRQHYRSHIASHSPLLPNPDPRAPTRPAPGTAHPLRQGPGAWMDMDR